VCGQSAAGWCSSQQATRRGGVSSPTVVIGLIRTLFRIRWRMTESLIGSLFSRRLVHILRCTPGAWSLIFFTVATSTIVGYTVGMFMDSVGAPTPFSSGFTGPVAVLLVSGAGGGAGGGVGDLLLAFCIALILILACVMLAVVVAIAANIIFAMFIGAVGGSIKGATKALVIATVGEFMPGERQSGPKPPSIEEFLLRERQSRPKPPLILLCKDSAVTGLITGLITSFLFAVNGVATHGSTDGGGIHIVSLSVMVWVWSTVLVPFGSWLIDPFLSWLIYLFPVIIALPSLIRASRP
jgi:hypothetical protein